LMNSNSKLLRVADARPTKAAAAKLLIKIVFIIVGQ
jgi:hypothetical protein